MQDTVPCPKCNRELKVPDQLLGKLVKCPACSQTFTAALAPPLSPPADHADPDTYGVDRQSQPSEDIPDLLDEMEEDDSYEPRSRRRSRRRDRARAAVAAPAIALMVFGITAAVVNIGMMIFFLFVAMNMPPPDKRDMNRPGQAVGYEMGKYSWSVGGCVGLCFSGLVILGGLKMKSLESFGLAITACVIAILPCNYCCFIGIPFGIWGLITLNNTDVKSAFS